MGAASGGSGSAAIVVENLAEDEALSYPLVLLEGRVTGVTALPPALFLSAGLDPSRSSLWPVARASGRFKALVLLPEPGTFAITLRVEGLCERVFCIKYEPPSAPRYVVKFHYQKCCDAGEEGFDAPSGVDNSDRAAIAKLRFNALLLQMATAELLHAAGLPRRTFALQFAADGLPEVTLLRSRFTNAKARSIHDQELIKLVQQDIEAAGLDAHAEIQFKHAVVLGCSRYNPETRKAEGHTALGGGKVGVFGSCGLHTWPTHLGEVSFCCLNNRRIDQSVLLDDSCFRGTFWANFATGIGAMLHEIGHTFGLGHSTSGVMARGFDDMNRLLCVYEADPRSKLMAFHRATEQGWLELNHVVLREVSGRDGAHWNAGSAQLLRHCPWISGRAKQSLVSPTVSWDDSVRGPVGLGQGNGKQIALPEGSVASSVAYDAELGAVLVDAGKYLNRLETFSRAELAAMARREPLRAAKDQHWFLLADGEFLNRVDVRAMAWIDGLQLHTNLRSSRWFGGTGGQLHALQAAEGWRVSAFFGTRGDSYVGTLGLRCLPLSSTPRPSYPMLPLTKSAIQSLPAAGKALEGGAKTPFSLAPPVIAAIVFRCGRFLESPIRLLSSEELAANCSDPKVYHSNDHVFELLPDEKLVKLEVSSGHWVDCVRLTTTLRTSPWFGGGRGPDSAVLECPVGHHICGFHGTYGKNYVGAVGALFRADAKAPYPAQGRALADPQEMEEQRVQARSWPFSVMGTPSTGQVVSGALLGILVAVQDGAVASVQSFGSIQTFDELVNHLHATLLMVGKPYQVHCFPVAAGEKLVQIDASFRPAGGQDRVAVIDGVCFHTTARCSSWFGAYCESSLRFFIAPQGSEVLQISGDFTNSVLTDLTGLAGSAIGHTSPTKRFEADGRVLVDGGTYDVRLKAASPSFGIQSVLLVKKKEGDHRDAHAWTWSQPNQPCPRIWRVPQRMLEDRVPGTNRKSALFRDYLVGAVDSGGAHSKTPAPL
ncbi:hypothetical protein BBJ28_00000179 [Nothophytophthora sp. Chile5]|nr:hypothetical protein BBJ28_00000179 [Nothophytophthora sp. Chile5]